MGLSLNEDEMRPFIVKAIMDGISAESRDHIITQAVAGLMERANNSQYSTDKRTVLQVAFADAIREVARKAVSEYITETPAVYDRIRSQIADLMAAMPVLDEADIRDAVIQTLVEKLYADRR